MNRIVQGIFTLVFVIFVSMGAAQVNGQVEKVHAVWIMYEGGTTGILEYPSVRVYDPVEATFN